MGLWKLLNRILRYVMPYRWLVVTTLLLTLLGSILAQVNALVLDRAVDAINVVNQQPQLSWKSASRILLVISAVLLGKELLAAVVNFFRRYYGERMRILVSRDLSLQVVKHILTFKMAFFTTSGNEAGRLQSRIDKGVTSTSKAVNSFFIDILPLFTSAVLALILMFAANFYVGLVALCIVPIYFYVTYIQAERMRAGRKGIFDGQQAVSQSILNIIESIPVIKSFNREEIEHERQKYVQDSLTNLQLSTRKKSYFFTGLKGFLEQIGTVLVIILCSAGFTIVYSMYIESLGLGDIMGRDSLSRVYIWEAAFDLIKKYPIFGSGTEIQMAMLDSAHNTVLSWMKTIGLIPTVTYAFFLARRRPDTKGTYSKVAQIAVIASLLVSFFESFYADSMFCMSFMLFFLQPGESSKTIEEPVKSSPSRGRWLMS